MDLEQIALAVNLPYELYQRDKTDEEDKDSLIYRFPTSSFRIQSDLLYYTTSNIPCSRARIGSIVKQKDLGYYIILIRILNKGLQEARPTSPKEHISIFIDLYDGLLQDLVTLLQAYSRSTSPKP